MTHLRYLYAILFGVLSISSGFGDEPKPAPPKKLPVPGETFLIGDVPAFIMRPEEKLRKTPQPWVWYAPTLPGLPDEAERWMHEQFLAKGIAVAGIDVGESYGSPTGREKFTALYKELTEKRGFSRKPVLLCRSRGGLMVLNWAVEHPESVGGIAGIYPVFDWRSWPGTAKAAPAYGLSADELEKLTKAQCPIERVQSLIEAKVPVFLIHGDADIVVPLEKNSAELQRRYEEAGAGKLVELIVPPGQGHNYWEGFFKCKELVRFVDRESRK